MNTGRFLTSLSDKGQQGCFRFAPFSSTAIGPIAACLLSACSGLTAMVPPVPDGSAMGDSGPAKPDTGPTTMDSGTATGDSGSETMDSGTAAGDSSSGMMDSGTAASDSGSGTNPVATACPASDAGSAGVLSFANQTYATDPRLLRKDEAIFSGINTLDDPYTQKMRLHNGSASPVTITDVGISPQANLFPAGFRQHSVPAAFRATVLAASDAVTDAATTSLSLPTTVAANGDLDVEIQFLSTNTNPPSRFDNAGGEAVAALLVARTSADCVQAGLYGVSLWNNPESISEAGIPSGNYARYEPTFGQIIATLGYQVNVGDNLKTYLNVNQVTANAMAPPPAGDTPSDEVTIHDFVLADPNKPAVLLAPARFAPKVDYPFGWFATGSVTGPSAAQPAALPPLKVPGIADFPPGLQYVAAMSSRLASDSYTSDHSEMVLPPIDGNAAGTFSPQGGFGLWCFSAQRSDGSVAFDGGVNPNVQNGDYNYSYDELNVITQVANPPLPADLAEAGVNFGMYSPVHRYRIWPLKDRAGNPVANSYLIGLEEASNDDYQDMVFTLSNVKPLQQDAGSNSGTDAATTDAGAD